jgi:hypothetical protein
MPYTTEFVMPKALGKRKGVVVYHIYKGDDIENGPTEYYFTTDPVHGGYEELTDGITFDVRELLTWKEPKHPPYIDSTKDSKRVQANKSKVWDKWRKDKVYEKAVRKAIKAAIDKGEIRNPPKE